MDRLKLCWLAVLPLVCGLITLHLTGCRPEMPLTSVITIDAESTTAQTNKKLYGLSFEEINHAIDGGIYAELIQNRSFEDGVPPLNCPYDPSRNVLITPNGWSIPFMRPDSIPGWRCLSSNTNMYADGKELLNDKNRRSLFVSVKASMLDGRGGVVAEGYKGIPIRKGEKYNLSLFIKGSASTPNSVHVALEDSAASSVLSDVADVFVSQAWSRFEHTFTANSDADNAVLTISADTSAVFWLDVVSLFPEKTWNNRTNGLNLDLMEKIKALNPAFIRFPGGSFVEGYTAGTYPEWKETIGDIAGRKHFWGVWAYGTTNGVGFHEYLQMCEDLGAEPVYVINSGVTSQSRRPRYEDITAMDKLVQDALDAIAYANEPADSTFGAVRAANGHPDPFHLKYIEIGSENYGQEYSKRFTLFKDAIKEAYPDITIISSSFISRKNRADWVDSHFYSDENYFISNSDHYETDKSYRRSSGVFIGEFGSVTEKQTGTLQNAIAEGCFFIGAESNPDIVKRLAYAPVLANANFARNRSAMIAFNNSGIVLSPSYYLMQLFANNQGDEVLKTDVDTYKRPQVALGRAAIELFGNSFEIKDVKINDTLVANGEIQSGGWVVDNGVLTPEANRWNCFLMGNPAIHDYELTATIRRIEGSGHIQFRVRDNGLADERRRYIGMGLGSGNLELYQQTGTVMDSLASPEPLALENNRWYTVKLSCKNEQIQCYVDDVLIHEVNLRPLPSLVSVATLDKKTNTILLKVINTTRHEEITELVLNGVSVKNEAELIQLTGLSDAMNTFDNPQTVVPVKKHLSFPIGRPMVYKFPPSSITLLKLQVD